MSDNDREDGTIIEFLLGSHSFDGLWFGQVSDKKQGAYWWRSILREYIENMKKEPTPPKFFEKVEEMSRNGCWTDEDVADIVSYCSGLTNEEAMGWLKVDKRKRGIK